MQRTDPPSLIKQVCFHYLNKSRGKYSQPLTSNRYLYQLIDEILSIINSLDASQVSQAFDSENNSNLKKSEKYQELLNEWKKYFPMAIFQQYLDIIQPESSGLSHSEGTRSSYVSPKQVAKILMKLSEENKSLKENIVKIEKNNEKNLELLYNSVNSQIYAYRNQKKNEKITDEKYFYSLLEKKDEEIKKLNETMKVNSKRIYDNYLNNIKNRRAKFRATLEERKKKSSFLIMKLKLKYSKLYTKASSLISKKNNMLNQLKVKNNFLKQRYNDLALTLNEEILSDSEEEDESDENLEDEEDEEEEEEEEDDDEDDSSDDISDDLSVESLNSNYVNKKKKSNKSNFDIEQFNKLLNEHKENMKIIKEHKELQKNQKDKNGSPSKKTQNDEEEEDEECSYYKIKKDSIKFKTLMSNYQQCLNKNNAIQHELNNLRLVSPNLFT